MTFRTTLTTWTLVVACLGGFGCLRGSQSDPCEILKDCLCGELAGQERAQCIAGDNRAGLAIDVEGNSLPSGSCEVSLHQQGDACPSGDLGVGPRDPEPARTCVHDGDCPQLACDCGGTAAVTAPVRGCRDGACLDAEEECARRCLMGRTVRGDPCRMLQRCRCAPLFDDPERDAQADGVPDLDACLDRFDRSSEGPEACLEAARNDAPEGADLLPTLACPDADTFVTDAEGS